MILVIIALFSFICAVIPALMFLANLKPFVAPELMRSESTLPSVLPAVSVLIPARNEAAGIEAAITAAFQSRGVDVEVWVLDDHSTDQTAAIVRKLASEEPRLRLAEGKPLPEGWNGKQHACFQLAALATHRWLAFIDADVRLRPDALAKMVHYQTERKVALLSAFPHQITGTWSEKWLIPLMHFILLGFLPFRRMRTSVDPAYAAGCGQFFLTSKSDYELAGTHAAIRGSRHDGVKLPRAYRAKSLATDVVDGTFLAECRMYRSASEVTNGLLKNAIEGIANPKLIVPFSVMLFGGAVLPWIVTWFAWRNEQPVALALGSLAIFLSFVPRALAARAFHQSWQGVLFHPLSLVWFLALQWQALFLHLTGRKVLWRGRG